MRFPVYLACVSVILAACATSPSPLLLPGGFLVSVTEQPDKSQVYRFKNGASCLKSPDYTHFVKASGTVAIKQLFQASGSYEEKMEKAKTLSPKFEELSAAFFDICYEYGEERMSKDRYLKLRQIYEEIRQRSLDRSAGINITQAVLAARISSFSGSEFGLDITVRNATTEVVQLDQVRLDFYGQRGSALLAVTEVSNTYTVLIDPTKNPPEAIVNPQKGGSGTHPAYAWFPGGCSDRFIVKSPIWQTISPNTVDRFILKVVFPKHECLEKARFDRAKLEIIVNGSETLKYPSEIQM